MRERFDLPSRKSGILFDSLKGEQDASARESREESRKRSTDLPVLVQSGGSNELKSSSESLFEKQRARVNFEEVDERRDRSRLAGLIMFPASMDPSDLPVTIKEQFQNET